MRLSFLPRSARGGVNVDDGQDPVDEAAAGRTCRLLYVAVSDLVVRHRLALLALVGALEATPMFALLPHIPDAVAGKGNMLRPSLPFHIFDKKQGTQQRVLPQEGGWQRKAAQATFVLKSMIES
ncbi:unnamed protein product [Polarella glacialis]|uniref:Uncharacterized protein n=1 Tax=Polarella glacialis TaxID=89957 RepID=A0A813F5Q4_POLGL|nr:unnamed protein product [Polarella glacialis]CAE8704196.1 unnamed protein product [Polarella glacialis]